MGLQLQVLQDVVCTYSTFVLTVAALHDLVCHCKVGGSLPGHWTTPSITYEPCMLGIVLWGSLWVLLMHPQVCTHSMSALFISSKPICQSVCGICSTVACRSMLCDVTMADSSTHGLVMCACMTVALCLCTSSVYALQA